MFELRTSRLVLRDFVPADWTAIYVLCIEPQVTRYQSVLRLWPESDTTFFLKELDAQLSFVRDAQGAVTAVVLHQNGQDMTAPKVRAQMK